MAGWVKRVFGTGKKKEPAEGTRRNPRRVDNGISLQRGREVVTRGEDRREASDAYFDSMHQARAAIAEHDYEKAARLVRKNLATIPNWIKERKDNVALAEERGVYGEEESEMTEDEKVRLPPSIHAFQQGGTVLALVGDQECLSRMADLAKNAPLLNKWVDSVEDHLYNLNLFEAIQDAIRSHPNCLQKDVKGLVGEQDGRRVANLISYLEKAGRIVRVKEGRTYRILPGDAKDVPTAAPRAPVVSHRTDKTPPRLRQLDIASLDYVPLPRSPMRWEEAQVTRERMAPVEIKDHFEVLDADWTITNIESIPLPQRPDTAFRKLYPNDSGLLMIDDLGKAEGMDGAEASALRYGRSGRLDATAGLGHGVYRVGVHPLGSGFIAMSKDCVLHAYNENLQPIVETPLDRSPEIRALRNRFQIPDKQLKNHIRCVALSETAQRYLFTSVDEAWCVDVKGRGLWGTRFPLKDGWERIPTPTSAVATDHQVQEALDAMGLAMPFTPEDLKRRYRELAKRHHPDLNPNTPRSGAIMRDINQAAEVLTGVDTSAIPSYALYAQEVARSTSDIPELGVTVSFGMSMVGREKDAADWIYAAAFAAGSDAVYLASYSGRVVLVDQNGNGLRVYDIGSVPRQIVDTGDYLYLLTDTRLYVLRDNALCALLDTFEAGSLVVAQTGFGLLQAKRLRWFREDGRYLGSVVTKAPIRRVYSNGDTMTVETRQRRATLRGVPTWWE